MTQFQVIRKVATTSPWGSEVGEDGKGPHWLPAPRPRARKEIIISERGRCIACCVRHGGVDAV